MIITCRVASIIESSPVIVDPRLYDSASDRCDDHFGIEVTMNCSRPTELKKGDHIPHISAIFLEDIQLSVMSSSTDGTTD